MAVNSLYRSISAPLASEVSRHSSAADQFLGFDRRQLISMTFIVVVMNAMLQPILQSISLFGLVNSLFDTFKISAVVWVSVYIALKFAWNIERKEVRRLDIWSCGFALLVCFLPVGPITWIVLSGLSICIIFSSGDGQSSQARAGWIFLAITVPMFWSKRLFSLFSDYILAGDAMLVSSITQTARTANLVVIPGGGGVLEIGGPCSSFANVSLAVLCWVLFSRVNALQWSYRNVVWCISVCVLVILINVGRISLIGYYPEHYDIIHNGLGATLASWITSLVCIAVCHYGVQYEKRRKILV